MNLLVWLVIGACAGSLAAMTLRQNVGLFANVALGIAGAVIGGMIFAQGDITNAPLTVTTFSVSLIGAVASLVIANTVFAYALRQFSR